MGDAEHVDDGQHAEVEQVGPDARLLLVLVMLVVLGVAWMYVRATGGGGEPVPLGSIEDVAERAAAGPIRLVELPHLVVARTPVRDAPQYQARWGENSGTILLSASEQLVVLETTDPVDGAPLTWCPTRDVFEHPDGERFYAPDGLLVAGDGLRGMDRRALVLSGAAQVEVDDGRWVAGQPRRSTDTTFVPRGASCLD